MPIDQQHIPFTKMQGAGNDFVIIDNRSLQLSKAEIGKIAPDICNRKYGIGADGIMALLPAEQEQVDYTMFYLNPDGSNAGMCGNGGRCMALFASTLGYARQHQFNVHERVYTAQVNDNSVNLTFPTKARVQPFTLHNRRFYEIHAGTEHIVTHIDADRLADEKFLKKKGKELRFHSRFHPTGTNVNFISGLNDTHVRLQTYERGVEDLTLACGTGAIASALGWHHTQENHDTDSLTYTVLTKGGKLEVEFFFDARKKSYNDIKLKGPAHFVFTGEYIL